MSATVKSFGKYLLDEEIARGGMSRVFSARLRGLGGFEKRLVVKQVLPELVRRGIGVLGMKPLANGIILRSGSVTASECLRYALHLPTDVVITGIDSMAVLEQALEVAGAEQRLRQHVEAQAGVAPLGLQLPDGVDRGQHQRVARDQHDAQAACRRTRRRLVIFCARQRYPEGQPGRQQHGPWQPPGQAAAHQRSGAPSALAMACRTHGVSTSSSVALRRGRRENW